MTRRRATVILLPAIAVLSVGCAGGKAGKPDLPLSVTPGWTLQNFDSAAMPAGVPAGVQAECWKANYTSITKGSAETWICGYAQESSAFDAMQRARAEANTVKFQVGKYLALVRWTGVSREEITALVRAVQKSLPAK